MTIASQKFKVCKGLDMEDKQRPIILFGKGCFNIFSKKYGFGTYCYVVCLMSLIFATFNSSSKAAGVKRRVRRKERGKK